MNLRKYFNQIKYTGVINSKKKKYIVFENSKYFLVISSKSKSGISGNYNIVNRSDIFKVYNKFVGKKSVTMNEIKSKVKLHDSDNPMQIYNILYAMSANGLADIDKRYTASKSLFFNFRKKSRF